jgi:hypothetical protein
MTGFQQPASLPAQQNMACDGTETGVCRDGRCTHAQDQALACLFNRGVDVWYGEAGPPPTPPPAPAPAAPAAPGAPATDSTVIQGFSNFIENGNFELGFYPVPELGFEPPDIGNVPIGWNWYKSQTYGKYKIDNNERLGITCGGEFWPERTQQQEDDPRFAPVPGIGQRREGTGATGAGVGGDTSSLELHMQSTDQQDARLGVYQTVEVVPGEYYRFSMSGTLQIQSGASTLQPDDPDAPEEAQNHTIELFFDQAGNTDWRAIPHERWTILPWEEQKLEFQVSEDNEDIAEIEDYYTYIRAQSNRMTIFITLWRKWANWRTGIGSIDCVALLPVEPSRLPAEVIRAAASGAPVPIQPAVLTQTVQSGGQPGLPTTGQEDSQLQTAPAPQSQPETTLPSTEPEEAAPAVQEAASGPANQPTGVPQSQPDPALPQTGQEVGQLQQDQPAGEGAAIQPQPGQEIAASPNQPALPPGGSVQPAAQPEARPAQTLAPPAAQEDRLMLIILITSLVGAGLITAGIWRSHRR